MEGEGGGGMVARRGPAPKNYKLKIEKKEFFDFKQKKEPKSKGNNVSH